MFFLQSYKFSRKTGDFEPLLPQERCIDLLKLSLQLLLKQCRGLSETVVPGLFQRTPLAVGIVGLVRVGYGFIQYLSVRHSYDAQCRLYLGNIDFKIRMRFIDPVTIVVDHHQIRHRLSQGQFFN